MARIHAVAMAAAVATTKAYCAYGQSQDELTEIRKQI